MLQKSRELSQKRKNADGEGESSEDDVVEMVIDDIANIAPSSGLSEQNPWMHAKVKVRKMALEPVVNSEVNSMAQGLEDQNETSVDIVPSAKTDNTGESSAEGDSEPNKAIDDIFSSIGQRESKKKTPQKTTKKSRKTRTKKKRKARVGELATGKDVESLDGGKNTQTIVHDLSDYVHMQSGGIRMSLTRRKAQEDFEGDMSDDEADATPSEAPKKIEKPKSATENKDKLVAAAVDIDPKKFFTVGKPLKRSKAPDLVADDDEGGFVAEDDQRMTIAQAFASDDVVEEFQQEKKTTEQRDVPKDIDLSLPGWGSWAGAGLVPSKRKRGR